MAIIHKVVQPIRNLNKSVIVACSGGADSMALLHFMSIKDKNVKAVFVNHRTEEDQKALLFVHNYCQQNNICLHIVDIKETYNSNKEHNWRNERYQIFHSFENYYVMTGHHLDDQVESYLMHSIKGLAKLIPHRNKNVIRPFLYCTKQELLDYCEHYCVPYYNDPSNFDESNARAIVRNQIVPVALKINPGLYLTVRKLIENSSYVWK